MLLLIVGTIAYSLFIITVRASQRHSCNMLAVGMVNYIVAATVYCVLSRGAEMPNASVVALGVAGGVVFAIGFVVLVQTLRSRGLSVTTGLTQLAVLFPVVSGIALYAERPNPLQAVGVVCALAALPLLGMARAPASVTETAGRASGVVILQLVTAGTAMVILQSFNHVGTGVLHERRMFFAILFVTATIITTTIWLIFERRITRKDLTYGAALGGWNAVHGFMLVGAMNTLPGMVVWPVVSASALMLSVLVGVKLWDEQLGRTGRIGMALALVAVLCINARQG